MVIIWISIKNQLYFLNLELIMVGDSGRDSFFFAFTSKNALWWKAKLLAFSLIRYLISITTVSNSLFSSLNGWGWGIRTPEWRSQSPLPYHLANPQNTYILRTKKYTLYFLARVLYVLFKKVKKMCIYCVKSLYFFNRT